MFLLHNTKLPEVEEAPEALEYVLKHNMLSNYGAAYTISNLDDEIYVDLLYMQECLLSESKATEWAQKKTQFYSKEGILDGN